MAALSRRQGRRAAHLAPLRPMLAGAAGPGSERPSVAVAASSVLPDGGIAVFSLNFGGDRLRIDFGSEEETGGNLRNRSPVVINLESITSIRIRCPDYVTINCLPGTVMESDNENMFVFNDMNQIICKITKLEEFTKFKDEISKIGIQNVNIVDMVDESVETKPDKTLFEGECNLCYKIKSDLESEEEQSVICEGFITLSKNSLTISNIEANQGNFGPNSFYLDFEYILYSISQPLINDEKYSHLITITLKNMKIIEIKLKEMSEIVLKKLKGDNMEPFIVSGELSPSFVFPNTNMGSFEIRQLLDKSLSMLSDTQIISESQSPLKYEEYKSTSAEDEVGGKMEEDGSPNYNDYYYTRNTDLLDLGLEGTSGDIENIVDDDNTYRLNFTFPFKKSKNSNAESRADKLLRQLKESAVFRNNVKKTQRSIVLQDEKVIKRLYPVSHPSNFLTMKNLAQKPIESSPISANEEFLKETKSNLFKPSFTYSLDVVRKIHSRNSMAPRSVSREVNREKVDINGTQEKLEVELQDVDNEKNVVQIDYNIGGALEIAEKDNIANNNDFDDIDNYHEEKESSIKNLSMDLNIGRALEEHVVNHWDHQEEPFIDNNTENTMTNNSNNLKEHLANKVDEEEEQREDAKPYFATLGYDIAQGEKEEKEDSFERQINEYNNEYRNNGLLSTAPVYSLETKKIEVEPDAEEAPNEQLNEANMSTTAGDSFREFEEQIKEMYGLTATTDAGDKPPL